MKTTTTLLISAIMMAGTIQFAAAQNEDRAREGRARTQTEKRVEKATKDQRVDKKKAMAPTRTVTGKSTSSQSRSTARKPESQTRQTSTRERDTDRRNESQTRPAPSQNREGTTRSYGGNSGNRETDNSYRDRRNESGNRNIETRPQPRRERVQDPRIRQREEQQRQRERIARGHRAPDRYFWRWDNRRDDHRHYARFHERRCHYCSGHGYTIGHHGFGRIHCNHCNGLGLFRIRFVNIHTCPLCFNLIDQHARYQDYTLEELAWMETNRLDIALDLDEYQEGEIYLINFEYLTERRFHRNYTIQKRNREIRKVLDPDQRYEFSILYNDVPREFLCGNCAHYGY